MPTTDPRIAVAVLDSLRQAGTRSALLQSSSALRSLDPTGDIDIVTDTAPRIALAQVSSELDSQDISLVCLWPYDVGGTSTAFFFSANGDSGAQVDMLYDPRGLGHYSVRSAELLAAADDDPHFPTVRPPHLTVYLFSKRTRKKQNQALALLQQELAALPPSELDEVVGRLVTSPKLAKSIVGRLPQHMSAKARYEVRGLQVARFAKRIIEPIGFWVHLPGNHEELARSIAERFGNVLVRTSSNRYPAGPVEAWKWFAREVQPTRLRPGLIATWGTAGSASGPKPDLIVANPETLDQVSRGVVTHMADRLRKP